MSWKDISKSSYTVESAKFTLARPSHPFTIPYQGPKVRYSEGDEMTSVLDYRFNLDLTGEPLDDRHFPCGYWHKNYIPPFTVIYTSLLYPLEVFESIYSNIDIISGIFRSIVLSYDYGVEDLETYSLNLIEGNFRSTITTYGYQENIETASLSIISVKFSMVMLDYDNRIENIETNSLDLISGIFRDAVINADDDAPESIETFSLTFIGGVHG